jgi:hypothetical protein
MSTTSDLGLRRLIEYNKRNYLVLPLSNAPTVSNIASKAQADKPVAVQADFPNNGGNSVDYNRLNLKCVLYLKQR